MQLMSGLFSLVLLLAVAEAKAAESLDAHRGSHENHEAV